jgi:eukaryotic-like serine/threonine-protein kinase
VTTTEHPVFNDRYEVQSRIGRGGMADVFLARDRLLDRPVAVKVLFPEHASDPSFVERFKREAQSAANLTHPNIVGVYDWGKQGTTYFIVMEYVNGRSLADIIRSDGALLPQRAADITNDVAAALGFAHSSGVVHRDVKPGNILVSPSGNVKVADFGIARALNSAAEAGLTQAGAVMGTASYFSPEQAQGANPDPRSDLYSLGIVMYEMVSGQPPFSGGNPVSIAYKQVHEPVPPLRDLVPDVPSSYDAIVTKLLAKQPANRYQNAEELRLDLKRFREGGTVDAALPAPVVDPTIAFPQNTPAAGTTVVKPAPATTVQPRQPAAVAGAAKKATAPVKQAPRPPAGPTKRPVGPPTGPSYDEPSRTGWYIAAAVLGIALIGVLGLFLSKALGKKTPVVAPTTNEVIVPTLTNQSKEVALKLLETAGLPSELQPKFSEAVNTGIVWDQDPKPGTSVEKGTKVTVIWNPGVTKKILGNYIGKTEKEATDSLSLLGLPTDVTPVDSDEEVGKVIDQDPKAGEVPAGTRVKLVVSGGKALVVIPNVALLDQVLATSKLVALGFTVKSETVPNDSVQDGRVIGTDPPADKPVAKGSEVKLLISGGVGTADLPNLKDKTELEARTLIVALGMPEPSSSQIDVPAGSPEDGKVVSQIPLAGKVSKKTQVTLKIGRALPVVTTTTTLPPTTTTTIAAVAPQLKIKLTTTAGAGPFTFAVTNVGSAGSTFLVTTNAAGTAVTSGTLTGTVGPDIEIKLTAAPTGTWAIDATPSCVDASATNPAATFGSFDAATKTLKVVAANVKNGSVITCTIGITKTA